MNDDRIEELLRKSWSPEPPVGMRERVLRRAGRELEHSAPRPAWTARWKLALASLGVLVILVTNVSDFARQARLSAATNGVVSSVTGRSLPWRKHQIEILLAQVRTDRQIKKTSEGGGAL